MKIISITSIASIYEQKWCNCMHSFNFPQTTSPTNKFLYVLPYSLNNRFDVIDPYLIDPYVEAQGQLDDLTLLYMSNEKVKNAAYYKKQTGLIEKIIKTTKTEHLYITDAQIFTRLTGKKSPTRYYGLPVYSNLEGCENTLCYLGVNPEATFISDTHQQAMVKSVDAFSNAARGVIKPFTPSVLKSCRHIYEIEEAIQKLKEYFELPEIAVDIETKGLKHTKTGIEIFSFAKNEYEGFAIAVDRNEPTKAKRINSILRAFFKKYKGKLIWHGGKFDRKIITNRWYDIHESPMYSDQHEDTMVMAYCCLNSVEKPSYKLKDLAFEFLGDFGIDVTDTTQVSLPILMDYAVHDACATFYLKKKFQPLLEIEEQLGVYRHLFMPSLKALVKTELSGIPVSPERTKEFIKLLNTDQGKAIKDLQNLTLVQKFNERLKQDHCDKRNAKLKTKTILITDDECKDIAFNPGSPQQLQKLLFEEMELPVISRTKSKAPSTDKDTMEALINHVKAGTEEYDVVFALSELSKCKMLIQTFVPILETAITDNLRDGVGYIYGSFNIPGTITGRLSSSEPNLQNMPSTGTRYAKAFKRCLIAPPGKVLVAVDFDSLEDRIAAKTTQDPNKLKVYTDGFDGHSLRAYHYYPNDIPRMNEVPDEINIIADTHSTFRQDSKPITFALTYRGTYKTLMKNCGLDEETAKRIEANYHELYKVADKYVDDRIAEASKTGFVTGAFGFKLRAAILKRVLLNHRNTPTKIEKITRTLGNMLGQSYGLLNSRAANEVFDECVTANIHRHIYPIAQIHDAQYFVVDDDPKVLFTLCNLLKKAVSWDDLPELQQDDIPLSGTPQLSFDSWAELEDIEYNNYDEFFQKYREMKNVQ